MLRTLRYSSIGCHIRSRSYSTDPNNKISNAVNAVKQGSGQMMHSIANNQIVKDVSELITAMEKRRYNLRFIGFGIAGLTILGSYKFIRSWTSEQATVITTQMLDDNEFNQKIDRWAQERAEVLIDNLVRSEQVKNNIRDLLGLTVIDLTHDQQVQDNLRDLFIRIFKSEELMDTGSNLSSDIVNRLAHDPEYEAFREQIIIYAVREIKRVSENNEVQGALSDMIWNSVKQIFTGKT